MQHLTRGPQSQAEENTNTQAPCIGMSTYFPKPAKDWLLFAFLQAEKILTAGFGPMCGNRSFIYFSTSIFHLTTQSFHDVYAWVWGARTLHAGKWS